MAAPRQGFGVLTIGAIFFVVFALMYGGVQLSKGELLPPDTTTEAEDDLRAAVWTEIADRRADRDVGPMPSDRFVRGIAQDTTDAFAAASESDSARTDQPTLTNHRLFCTQVPATTTVSSRSTADVAKALVDDLEASKDSSVLFRPSSQFRSGVGVAVEGDTAYVVFRSCEQVDT